MTSQALKSRNCLRMSEALRGTGLYFFNPLPPVQEKDPHRLINFLGRLSARALPWKNSAFLRPERDPRGAP